MKTEGQCCGYRMRRMGMGRGVRASWLRWLGYTQWECGLCREPVLLRTGRTAK